MNTNSIDHRSSEGMVVNYIATAGSGGIAAPGGAAAADPSPPPVILFVAIYGGEQTRAGAAARQRRAAHPGAARGTAAPRLRNRPAHRQPLRRGDQLPHHVALPD